MEKQAFGTLPCKVRPEPTPPMLINEISRLFRAKMREGDTDGLMQQDSSRQIMRLLACHEGCTQLELVTRTRLKPPTVSVALKRMEDEGVLYREADALDGRMLRVFLTEKGKTYNQNVISRLQATDRALMEGFSEDEIARLMQYLERIRNNILSEKERNDTK